MWKSNCYGLETVGEPPSIKTKTFPGRNLASSSSQSFRGFLAWQVERGAVEESAFAFSLLITCPASSETIPSAHRGIIFRRRSRVKTFRSLPCALQVQPRRKPDVWQQLRLVVPLSLCRRGPHWKTGFRSVSRRLQQCSAEVVLRAGRTPSKQAVKNPKNPSISRRERLK